MDILLGKLVTFSFVAPAIIQTAGDNVVLIHVSTGSVLDVLRRGKRLVRVCQ